MKDARHLCILLTVPFKDPLTVPIRAAVPSYPWLNELNKFYRFQSVDQLVSWVSLTPDIGTLAWAPLKCSGGSPASRTTRAHSPALGRTRDYSEREICHKTRTRNPRTG
jgi:hypothetical protein